MAPKQGVLVHDPKDACASTTPRGASLRSVNGNSRWDRKGWWCQSMWMREGVGATSLVHPDLVRDTHYLTFDRSQTDAVPSAVLVKTKRFTC